MKSTVYLSLGSNVGDRVRNLEGVLVFLAELPETVVDGLSRYYETKPVGNTEQRDFINRVVRLHTRFTPQQLKEQTRRIEDFYGRDRTLVWGPRAVDIDLLIYDDKTVDQPDLTIPHPRMWERAFVIAPLNELAPQLTSPDGLSVVDLAASFNFEREGVQVYTPKPIEQELDRPFPGVVLAGLDPEELGHPLVYKLEVTSTNDQLRQLAVDGAPEGTALVAETQFKGRGSKGRVWVSRPFAGLWLSVLLRPGIKPSFLPSMTIVGALAMARALNRFAPRGESKVEIKWPNDLVIGGAKIGGCLAEAGVQGEKLGYVVLGTGVNIHQPPDELSELDQSITSILAAWGKQVSRTAILRNYFLELTALYHDYLKHGIEGMLTEYESLSCTLGSEVVVLGPEPFTGRALKVTSAGSLVVETDNGLREVFASEVSIRNASF